MFIDVLPFFAALKPGVSTSPQSRSTANGPSPTIKVIASPEFGSLTVQGPSFSYTAKNDFHDQDSFHS